MAIYWKGFNDDAEIRFWSGNEFWWERWSTTWPNINLFPSNGTISYK
jgi:hypothetical protein